MRIFYGLKGEEIKQNVIKAIRRANIKFTSEIKKDLKEIKTYTFFEPDELELRKRYFKSNIIAYEELNNMYKKAVEGFEYEKLWDTIDLLLAPKDLYGKEYEKAKEDAKINFLLRFMESLLNQPVTSSEESRQLEVYDKNLSNLEDLIYDTHLAKLKYDYSLEEIHRDFNYTTLKSLFDKKDDYYIILDSLHKNGIITCLNLLEISTKLSVEKNRLICCLGYKLHQEGYLQTSLNIKITQKLLVNCLKNTFNVEISEAAYSASKFEFQKAENDSKHSARLYLNLLSFISR